MEETPDMSSDLRALQGDWEKTRAETAGVPVQKKPEQVPDGRWNVIVEGCTLGRALDSKPKLTWVLLVTSVGGYKGRKLWHDKKITSKSLKFVMADLKMCGVDVPDLAQLAAYLPAVRGVELEITLKTDGQYRNIYFNRRLSDAHEIVGDVDFEPAGRDAPLS